MGFDLDGAAFAGEPVTEAGPGPVFGLLDQTACDRIPVDIAQLFHPLGMGEHIEVVVAGLPELFPRAFEGFGCFALQHANCGGEVVEFRLAQEQVNVLGHEDVAEEVEAVPLCQPLECFEEDASGGIVGEIWETPGTTEGEEVVVALGVISLETARHEEVVPGTG